MPRRSDGKLGAGDSLDTPILQKLVFWLLFGIIILIVASILIIIGTWALIQFSDIGFFNSTLIWLIGSLILLGLLYRILCYSNTRILADGLLVRGNLTRKFKFYNWNEFQDFDLVRFNFNVLLLYLRETREIIRIGLRDRNPSTVLNYLEKKIKKRQALILQPNDSLDIPVSKFFVWAIFGSLFAFIGFSIPFAFYIFPLILFGDFIYTNPSLLIFSMVWLSCWLLLTYWFYRALCFPITRILERGISVQGHFLRNTKSFDWNEIESFAFLSRNNQNFLILYPRIGEKPLKIGTKRRSLRVLKLFLADSIHLNEKNLEEGENCRYHPKLEAHTLCETCGAPICRQCTEIKSYNTPITSTINNVVLIIHVAHYGEIKCLHCFYNQFKRMTKILLGAGLILGTLILFSPPYQGFLLIIFLSFIIAPFFFGIGTGANLGNIKRLRVMQEKQVRFNEEREFKYNKYFLIAFIIFTSLIVVRLFLLYDTYYWDGFSFGFQIAPYLYLIFHQFGFWVSYLKFKP